MRLFVTPRVLIGAVRFLVGAAPRYVNSEPTTRQAIYFANHSSHMDTVALWSALPPAQRVKTRPVAAKDYWGKTRFRRLISLNVLNAVLVARAGEANGASIIKPLIAALSQGDSLIIFPEGTRLAEREPASFKPGLFLLAKMFPDVDLVPVYLENLHRSLPKGCFTPVPMICTVRFGSPLPRIAEEKRDDFLTRARQSVIDLL
jgi:1-acyl-sn-glycerol-3-phosphate acyltransferase